jgi:hypothetical protein
MLQNNNIFSLIFKFYIFWFFLFLLGRGLVKFINLLNKKFKSADQLTVAGSKVSTFYPIIGAFFLGNLLFIIHFFLPIQDKQIIYIGIFSIFLNLIGISKKRRFSFDRYDFFSYFIIPAVLLVSSYDIAFHYDAGYYHLNHQNWLRESNMVIGLVNVYWPYGIGSIYEYISSILWIDDTFILLHFLNLVFVIFFYSFSLEHLLKIKNSYLKYPSLLIIIFAFLDNFGVNGGRNGYFYIQGVTAFDLVVGVLFYVTALLLFTRIMQYKFIRIEFHIFTILVIFLIQLKLSSIFILIFYIVYLKKTIQHTKKLPPLFKLISPYLAISVLWTIKSIFTSGCIVFPVNFTCLNFLNWYEVGSTKNYENITTSFSKAYIFGSSFTTWISEIFSDEIRRTVILNFIFSVTIIYMFKKIFLRTESFSRGLNATIIIFITFNSLYLILAGPTPRYAIGLMMFSVSSLGLNVIGWKYTYNFKPVVLFLFSVSLILTPKLDSYRSFSFQSNPSVFLEKIEYVEGNEPWVNPLEGDQCWINLYCTPSKKNIEIIDGNFYKIATRK